VKARNVSVSVVESDEGDVRVWACTFTIRGSIRKNGEINEALRKQLQKKIATVISNMEFSDE
jgi:hypothetical protein